MSRTALPGRSGLPIVGETVQFVADILAFVDARIRTFGTVFRTHVLARDTVIAASYDAVRAALASPERDLSAHAAFGEFLAPLYPPDSPLLAGPESAPRRRALELFDAAFTTPALASYAQAVPALVADSLQRNTASSSDLPPQPTSSSSDSLPLPGKEEEGGEMQQQKHAGRRSPPRRVRPYSTLKAAAEYILPTVVVGPLAADELARVRTLTSAQLAGVVAAPVQLSVLGARTARQRGVEASAQLGAFIRRRLADIERRLTASAPSAPTVTTTNAAATAVEAPSKFASVLDHFAAHVVAAPAPQRDEVRDAAVHAAVVLLSAATGKAVAAGAAGAVEALAASGLAKWQAARTALLQRDWSAVDAVLQESLRLRPPIMGAMRIAAGDGKGRGKDGGARVNGCPVKAGWRVWLSLFHANVDDAVFEDAREFQPQRWRQHQHHDAASRASTAGESFDKENGTSQNRLDAHPQNGYVGQKKENKTKTGQPYAGCPFAWPGEEELSTSAATQKTPLTFGAGPRRCKGRDLAWIVMRELVAFMVVRYDVEVEGAAAGVREAPLRYMPVVRPEQDKHLLVWPAIPDDSDLHF